MDAQKIAEAASTIKKVDHAEVWFDRVQSANVIGRTLKIDTAGDYTMVEGHGEAGAFLRQAFAEYQAQIFAKACFLANDAREFAKNVIRDEAGR